jgi:hypothetical protein
MSSAKHDANSFFLPPLATAIGSPEKLEPRVEDNAPDPSYGGGFPLTRMIKIAHIPTSEVLRQLLDEVSADHFTVGWLMDRLHRRSFGMIMLLLALVGVAPGISMAAGVLLAIPALQMIAGRHGPAFPRRIAASPLPTRHLVHVVQRALPILRFLEKVVHPRWPMPFEATKRVVGSVVLLLSALLLTPVPLTQIPPALVIALIALAYLEEDGVLLLIAMLAGVVVLTIGGAAAWEAVKGAAWIVRLW